VILQLSEDNSYTIQDIENSTWLKVLHKGKSIATVMSIETARQVIYREIIENGASCEFLNDSDFLHVEI